MVDENVDFKNLVRFSELCNRKRWPHLFCLQTAWRFSSIISDNQLARSVLKTVRFGVVGLGSSLHKFIRKGLALFVSKPKLGKFLQFVGFFGNYKHTTTIVTL